MSHHNSERGTGRSHTKCKIKHAKDIRHLFSSIAPQKYVLRIVIYLFYNSTMLLNYETCLSGEKTVLCPYRSEHVEKYHAWMKSPFLLEMTGSEPLSYEEEVKMQQSWRDDEDKCTFILLSREMCEPYLTPRSTTDEDVVGEKKSELLETDFIINTLDAMVGDVNLFLSEEEKDADDEVSDESTGEFCESSFGKGDSDSPVRKQAELDLMVAEEKFRGQGIGKEAACMMMIYGVEKIGIRKFTVKIKEENTASRHLFEKVRLRDDNTYISCRSSNIEKFRCDPTFANSTVPYFELECD